MTAAFLIFPLGHAYANEISVTLPDEVGHKYRRTFFGANCLQMLNRVDYTLPGFVDIYEDAQKPFFRFPGGTPSNFYNFETGFLDTTEEDKTDRRNTLDSWNTAIGNRLGEEGFTIDSFFEFAALTGADYSLTVNMTSFAPSDNRRYMEAIQVRGANPGFIELGNELYFGSYDSYMEDGVTYINEAAAHAAAMREVFPGAKYGAIIPSQLYTSESFLPDPEDPSPGRTEDWYTQLKIKQDFYDAVIIHFYSDLGMTPTTPAEEFIPYEEAYRNCISHVDAKLEQALGTLTEDFPEKDIWVTEFHVGGFSGEVRNYRLRYSYLGSLYANYFFFKLLSEPQVTIAHWHSFTQMFTVPSGTLDESSVLGRRVTLEVFKTLGEYVESYGHFSPIALTGVQSYSGTNGYEGDFDDVLACYLHDGSKGTLVLLNKLDTEYTLGGLSVANLTGSHDVRILGAKQVRPLEGVSPSDGLRDEESLTIESFEAEEVPGMSLPAYSITYIDIEQDWQIEGLPSEDLVIEHQRLELEDGSVQISYAAEKGFSYFLEKSLGLYDEWAQVDGAYLEARETRLQSSIARVEDEDQVFFRVVRREL